MARDTARGSSHSEEERAFLQQRVGLFWKAVFLITLIPVTLTALLDPQAGFMRTGAIMDRVSTLVFGGLWLACRRGRRSFGALIAIEWAGLAVISLMIAVTSRFITAEALAHFIAQVPGTVPGLALEKAADAYVSMMAITGGGLLFALRAAVVPSRPWRTFALTALLGAPLVAGPYLLAPASSTRLTLRTANFPVVGATTYAVFWLVISAGASVISRIVFGLRAEVRHARRLGQYTLEEKIGEGGMGVVYRARHGMMRRPTAIKLLKPELAGGSSLKRFEREVQLTARLTHPHTITIFDYGRTPDGVFYYAMELLEGASLERVVAVGGRLPPARVIHVLHEVAGALGEAHDVGLIHRDVKPANIILCRQGGMHDFAKVVDFGLVKDLEHGTAAGLTQADVVAGTPLYLAPEAVSAPESVGARSDLYALGAVGYFALTGHNVFEGRTVVEVCSHHLYTKPEPPSIRVGEALPADLEALVLNCLEKGPERRPATAREVRRRLESCADFGAWTEEAASAWWRENGAALAGRKPEALDVEVTLTRRLDSPRAE
jgi:eukaryotic-like serine/threonine-protein kinase